VGPDWAEPPSRSSRFVVRRDIWLAQPFEACPACGADDTLGVLAINEVSYTKRCGACGNVARRPLPRVPSPAVLLLDQWTASSLVKALLPDSREQFADPSDSRRQRGFWPLAYGKLERLVKSALLVCPESTIHREEAALGGRLDAALHRVFVHLSGGSSIRPTGQVVRWQLYNAFVGYLDGTTPRELSREDVVSLPQRWPQRLEIDARSGLEVDEAELRAMRERLDDQLSAVVDEWAHQPHRSFAERRDEQLRAFGPSYIDAPRTGEFFGMTWSAMEERGMPVRGREQTLNDFLSSDMPAQLPAARLRASLLAAVGWLAARQQLGGVTASLRWDLQSISAYAPYVDALFVDRQCHRLLRNTPVAEVLPAALRVFSVENLTDLERWLGEIEANAPAGHFDLLEQIYGPTWLRTYDTLLEQADDAPGDG
jgi:hypothetical protein